MSLKTVLISGLVAMNAASVPFASVSWAQTCPPSAHNYSSGFKFTTAAGKTLALPPIDGMECTDIDRTLTRIDATQYRGNAPRPENAADCPLLNYELLLAEENYNRCVTGKKNVTGSLSGIKRLTSE